MSFSLSSDDFDSDKSDSLKLTQRTKHIDKKLILEYCLIFCISVILFVSALLIKESFGNWYRNTNGVAFYWTRNYGDMRTIWYIEAYNDAAYYYEPYLTAFRFENWNPYAGGPDALNGYAYGPMFIYGLYFFSLFVSLFNPHISIDKLSKLSVKWTHIGFDAFCVVLLYLIIINLHIFNSKKIYRHILGFITAFVYIWIPFNLFYVDSLYLNIPQMTFFTLLSLFFFIKERYLFTSFLLAVAWLSKQMPLFLVIPWFLIIWKNKSLKKSLMEFLLPFVFFTLVISIPWIFLTPHDYIWRVFGPGKAQTVVELSSQYNGYTVTLAHSLKFFKLDYIAELYAKINAYQIPFFLFYLIGLLMAYFNTDSISNNENEIVLYTSWMILLTHVFIARGVYKYYDAFFSPFLLLSVILFVYKVVNIQQWQKSFFKGIVIIRVKTEWWEISFFRGKIILVISSKLWKKFAFVVIISIIGYGIVGTYALLIVIKTRYLHPFLLLILFVLHSFLLPSKYYKSLFTIDKYKMIPSDIKYIFGVCRQFVIKSLKIKRSYNKETKEKLKQEKILKEEQ
ncbi:MAG: hypothetical protein ACTSYD_03765 [Candidatus Heimdallarchaeaceae archaeon]